ncbi:uncharacterized protein GVI51_M08305 [Nakaseomyces glabratus]|uniref:Probable serine/threonine-protein kinase KKQ8 n=1 Tax=Candida glabrata (strain ATCC 2001 / BCRC 20586 / JCM 3761 / NBRC 0622 / NRRL Y-65 / CBS 138) TaxID=284593 RepID=KKQ8_CANGA|nr:uncharacterized protein CAGL0M08360g [Nakaseomyces glabratus]Q6FJ85.1 RecName: Full=Probable serine/threonine-protein kinase KKQ8 [Nakaseomyces glabratus CBS 138]KAH7579645.1 Serine/Threonine protein kinases active-site signature [Nakaseomyces glabratus]KAH7592825.1 Serine/Threonine protein kinases active-site signature [Nakaseomyces glabratus]KAH7593896.1 Serine/Threonine protein kinases active-site signature [Nakaseomyces glabratus]KAH7600346.1 Serine/Threonine protein kinases active-site|eukprot:XP_449709.1 uncharacterized protein CAGL0M08360g [[Candida] glabrata]
MPEHEERHSHGVNRSLSLGSSMRSLFKSQRSRGPSDRGANGTPGPAQKVDIRVDTASASREHTPVVHKTPQSANPELQQPRHHLGLPNILKLNLTPTNSNPQSKSGSPVSQNTSQESLITDTDIEVEDYRPSKDSRRTVRNASPMSSNGNLPINANTVIGPDTSSNNIDSMLDGTGLRPFYEEADSSDYIENLRSFPLPTGHYAPGFIQPPKSPTSSRVPSRSNSRKGREHAGTVSAAQLPRYNETPGKCILDLEYFKLYEDGHHVHTLKVMTSVNSDANGNSHNHASKNDGHLDLPKGDDGSVVRQKSKFSLSGFFKPHSKEDIANADEKLKYAVSLLPRNKICSKVETDRDTFAPVFTKTRSHVQSGSDDSSDDDEELDDPSIPKIVNKNAAVGSQELKLINNLSEKIRMGLSTAAKNKHNQSSKHRTPSGAGVQDENQPAFADLYGKCVAVVGHGAYGVVKVCARTRDEKDDLPATKTYMDSKKIYFAVKELKPRPSDPIEKFSTRITSEFIIGHSLSHYYDKNGEQSAPNILSIIDLLEYNDTFIEVMEFCPAGDLYSLLTARKNKIGKPLHPLEADCFMKQLLKGIQFMHDHGVAHCDLKPENILLHPNGLLKICDFGTSCVFQTAWERHVHFQTGLQGSEPYVAPEEYNPKKEYDPRLVDCWSIGIVYCTMIMGHYLWRNAARGKDSLYDSFYEEMASKKEFYVFEELRHINQEINRLRRIALYQIFQPNPEKRISIDKLLQTGWMRHTKCCVPYKNIPR